MSRGRAQKTPAVIDDQSSDLEPPEGWANTELADHVYVAGRIGWRGLKAEEYTSSGPILLSVPNLNYGDNVDFSAVNHVSRERFDESPEIQLQVGDTLLVKDGAGIGKLGFIAHLPSRATVNSSLLVVRPRSGLLEHRFLFYYLKGPQFQKIALQRITGSGTPHLFQRDIKSLRVLVPPVSEQRRIVAKIEELLAQVNATRARLAKVAQILKRFRQAVLAAACSGRLTEDWRAGQGPEGKAEKLLPKIISKRKARMEEIGLGAYKEALEPDSPQIPDVPEEWVSATMDQLICLVTSGSRGWAQYYSDSGPLFIRAQDISTDRLILSGVAHVTPPTNAEGRRTRVQPGDLLITITGANVTKSALVDIDPGEAYVSQHVALVRPIEPDVRNFLYLWIISPQHGRAKLLEDAYGAGKPGLNLESIKEMVVGIPSLEEQHEIVRRVEALFTHADAIEKLVEAATKQADKLTQAILAKAFRGELVATEAELARREGRSFEPASALLARIQAGRQVNDANVHKARKRRIG
jgi:type I restriction enzyme, S subunit